MARGRGYLARNRSALLLSMALVIVANILVANYAVDDAYISWRYADNLAEHGSLYYNVGERGGFGYTNPLYVGLLALLRLLTCRLLSCELAARLLASLSLLLMASALWSGRRGGTDDWLFRLCTFALLILFPYLLPNVFSGLETALLALVTLYLLRFTLREERRYGWRFSLALAVALSLRFDGIVLLLPIVGYHLIQIVSARRWHGLGKLALALLLAALLLVSNAAATGQWVSFAYGHKVNQGFSLPTFVAYLKLCALVPLPLLLLRSASGKWRQPVLLALYLIYIAAFYSLFAQWHFYRYIFPFLLAIFLALLADDRELRGRRSLLLLFTFYSLLTFVPRTLDGYQWVSGYRVMCAGATKIADALRTARLADPDRLFASYDAGLIAYRSGWRLLDLNGLTTAQVRSQPPEEAIAEANPSILIVMSTRDVDPSAVELWSLYHPITGGVPAGFGYVTRLTLTNRYWWRQSKGYYYIYARTGIDPALIASLRRVSVDPAQEIGYQRWLFRGLELLSRFCPA